MMKSRLSSKSLARAGLKLFFLLAASFIIGCSSSTNPTFLKEDIPQAIQDISKKEYKIGLVAKSVGSTLWVYVPIDNLVEPAKKPEKYSERFLIEENKSSFKEGVFEIDYDIKHIPEKEKTQEYSYNKEAQDKINNVWKVLRRVLFSMERTERKEPRFICLVTADIQNGFETKEVFYYLDMKKVSYDFISWGEYQHRSIQETDVSPEIINDKEGKHLKYRDFTLEEFIAMQIKHRIGLKFQKPEVGKNADIEKEILKIIATTIKIYNPKDFSEVQLYNTLSQNRIILNRLAILARPND